MAEESEKKETSPDSEKGLFERFLPILIVGSIALAFVVGILWQKVSNLEKGGKTAGIAATPPPANQPQQPTFGKLAEDKAKLVPEVTDNDHIRGSRDAKVFLIEYSDYFCPFCARFHPTAQQVVDEYDGQVAWVYRHFPLDQLHPNARKVAEGSECVTDLGGEEAFWAYSDELYEDQEKADDITSVAVNIGVDKSAFETCLDDGKYKERVDDQFKSGSAAGVTGTPGNLIVNDKGEAWLVPGAVPFEQLKTTIDEALGN